jgi:hypothetical protein
MLSDHTAAKVAERDPILDPMAWDIFEFDDGRFVTVLAIEDGGTVRYVMGAVSKQRAAADRSVRARHQSTSYAVFKDILKARAKLSQQPPSSAR